MTSILLRVFLSVLPLLDLASGPQSALVMGVVVIGILFASTMIFFLTRSLLPKSQIRLSFLLLATVFTLGPARTSFPEITGFEARLLLPLLLLLPPEFFRPRANWNLTAKKLLLTSLGFWVLLVIHGAAAEFLGFGGRFQYFRLPAGSYFLLGLLAVGARKR